MCFQTWPPTMKSPSCVMLWRHSITRLQSFWLHLTPISQTDPWSNLFKIAASRTQIVRFNILFPQNGQCPMVKVNAQHVKGVTVVLSDLDRLDLFQIKNKSTRNCDKVTNIPHWVISVTCWTKWRVNPTKSVAIYPSPCKMQASASYRL